MTEEESVLTNQTQFSYEEPFRQVPSVAGEKTTATAQSPKSRRMMLIVGGVVLFFILIILLVLVGRRPTITKTSPFQQPSEATPLPAEANPLRERVERLQTELEDADPTKQSLLFPPVDMDIRLDPKQ